MFFYIWITTIIYESNIDISYQIYIYITNTNKIFIYEQSYINFDVATWCLVSISKHDTDLHVNQSDFFSRNQSLSNLPLRKGCGFLPRVKWQELNAGVIFRLSMNTLVISLSCLLIERNRSMRTKFSYSQPQGLYLGGRHEFSPSNLNHSTSKSWVFWTLFVFLLLFSSNC